MATKEATFEITDSKDLTRYFDQSYFLKSKKKNNFKIHFR